LTPFGLSLAILWQAIGRRAAKENSMDRMTALNLDPTTESRLRAALGRLVETAANLDPEVAAKLRPALRRLVETVGAVAPTAVSAGR